MAEYIDRQTAFEEIRDAVQRHPSSFFGGVTAARHILDRIPTADVVPVVRCADCKWFQINMRQDGYLPKGVSEYECRHWCGECDPTDFCSYGARIDGAENAEGTPED